MPEKAVVRAIKWLQQRTSPPEEPEEPEGAKESTPSKDEKPGVTLKLDEEVDYVQGKKREPTRRAIE